MTSFELEFRLTEKQFCEAHRAYLRSALLTFKNLFLMTMALLIGVVQTQLFGAADWVLVVFGMVWLAIIGLSIFVYVRMPGRIYRARPGIADSQKVIIDEEGLDWLSGSSRRIIAWKEIERASDLHPDFVFFHKRHGLPDILPKAAFESDQQLQEFDRFVQKQLA